MATFDVDLLEDEGIALPWPGDKTFVMKRIVDFSDTDNALATDKIMALFNVPAYVCVKTVGFRLITADALMATSCYLGAYTVTSAGVITVIDEDGFAEDVVFNGTVGYIAPDVSAAYLAAQGFAKIVPWVITFTNKDANTCEIAKVEFYAICIDLR